MDPKIVTSLLSEASEDTLLADGFEDALMGIGRQANKPLAIYDYEKCIDILMERDGMDYAQATEWMEYNVVGAFVGPYTPIFFHRVYATDRVVTDAQ
jgi:hypothetical protein